MENVAVMSYRKIDRNKSSSGIYFLEMEECKFLSFTYHQLRYDARSEGGSVHEKWEASFKFSCFKLKIEIVCFHICQQNL